MKNKTLQVGLLQALRHPASRQTISSVSATASRGKDLRTGPAAWCPAPSTSLRVFCGQKISENFRYGLPGKIVFIGRSSCCCFQNTAVRSPCPALPNQRPGPPRIAHNSFRASGFQERVGVGGPPSLRFSHSPHLRPSAQSAVRILRALPLQSQILNPKVPIVL